MSHIETFMGWLDLERPGLEAVKVCVDEKQFEESLLEEITALRSGWMSSTSIDDKVNVSILDIIKDIRPSFVHFKDTL